MSTSTLCFTKSDHEPFFGWAVSVGGGTSLQNSCIDELSWDLPHLCSYFVGLSSLTAHQPKCLTVRRGGGGFTGTPESPGYAPDNTVHNMWAYMNSRLLVVCFFSYGPASVEGKRTHDCGMDEKMVLLVRDTPCLVVVSSQSLLALSSCRSRPIFERKTNSQQSSTYSVHVTWVCSGAIFISMACVSKSYLKGTCPTSKFFM